MIAYIHYVIALWCNEQVLYVDKQALNIDEDTELSYLDEQILTFLH